MKITIEFLYELFKTMLRNEAIVILCKKWLNYEFLPSEAWKIILKEIIEYHELTGKCITSGIIAQRHDSNRDIAQILIKINESSLPDHRVVIKQLESFIKQNKFVILYNQIGDLWDNNRKDEAFELLQSETEQINNTTFTSYNTTSLFQGFKEREDRRELQRSLKQSSPNVLFGVDQLDYYTNGLQETDTCLMTARSGVGKSTALRWVGVSAARQGHNVLHVQLEGSKDECLLEYDSLWTGTQRKLIRDEGFSDEKMEALLKIVKQLSVISGEVYVEAFEQFGSMSILDLWALLDAFEKLGIFFQLILLDYFEKAQPIDPSKTNKVLKFVVSDAAEQIRRRLLGEQLKNIAIARKTRILTPTQASTVSPEQYNNPNFVMTRYNISQFKAAVDPFSLHITLNQTDDELEAGLMRIHIDKNRFNTPGQTFPIYQARHIGRFYDAKRTRTEFKL